ncbi:tubulin-tyrosine ligase family [Stylonychia lemnae]|uniref:Tubulin-tyrosine ligase family n=1 Tax=Stylonychia lemnae TaxID=5949 RepID=A0A078ASS4_STYLE|nr:tubulin-tyrosine ligase family [Stylonychia lemnae]|eukprot:CDW84262.1 tubulin-tyrosine ligase family [Stylonychia lemnae]
MIKYHQNLEAKRSKINLEPIQNDQIKNDVGLKLKSGSPNTRQNLFAHTNPTSSQNKNSVQMHAQNLEKPSILHNILGSQRSQKRSMQTEQIKGEGVQLQVKDILINLDGVSQTDKGNNKEKSVLLPNVINQDSAHGTANLEKQLQYGNLKFERQSNLAQGSSNDVQMSSTQTEFNKMSSKKQKSKSKKHQLNMNEWDIRQRKIQGQYESRNKNVTVPSQSTNNTQNVMNQPFVEKVEDSSLYNTSTNYNFIKKSIRENTPRTRDMPDDHKKPERDVLKLDNQFVFTTADCDVEIKTQELLNNRAIIKMSKQNFELYKERVLNQSIQAKQQRNKTNGHDQKSQKSPNKDFEQLLIHLRSYQQSKTQDIQTQNTSPVPNQNMQLFEFLKQEIRNSRDGQINQKDVEYLKKQLFHHKSNKQRILSLTKTQVQDCLKNQDTIDQQMEDFINYYKSKSPEIKSSNNKDEISDLSPSQKDLLQILSAQTSKQKSGTGEVMNEKNPLNKHKHVYEFLKNAIQKFDPMMMNRVSQFNTEDIETNKTQLFSHLSNAFQIQSYDSQNSSSNNMIPKSIQNKIKERSNDSNNISGTGQPQQQQIGIGMHNSPHPNNLISNQKFKWINTSKYRRFKHNQRNTDEASDIMQQSYKNLELSVNNAILYKGDQKFLVTATKNFSQQQQDSRNKNDHSIQKKNRDDHFSQSVPQQQQHFLIMSEQQSKDLIYTATDQSFENVLSLNQTQNIKFSKMNSTRLNYEKQQRSPLKLTQDIKKQQELIQIIQEIKPPIKIFHHEDNMVQENKFNQMLILTNHLIRLTQKPYQQNNHLQITNQDLRILKRSGILIPKNLENHNFIRSREFCQQAREKALQMLTKQIQIDNEVPAKTTQDVNFSTQYAKFYVGFGNNFPLVRSILKNRWWMSMADKANFEECQLIWTSWRKQKFVEQLIKNEEYQQQETKLHIKRIYARMEDNFHLTNKKGLLLNMKEFYRAKGKCIFESHVFPHTYLVKSSHDDSEYLKLVKYATQRPDSIWIIKPGENSNRGCGISLCQGVDGIQKEIETLDNSNGMYSSSSNNSGINRTLIIQSYITNPLLINKRKFDIRVYGLLTCVYGKLKGYFYEDGYLRTSSKEFQLGNFSNKYIHLTNDAIQKKAEDYGKFENGNKLSYAEFQKYLESNEFLSSSQFSTVNFMQDILPQIRHLVSESFRSVAYQRIDPHRRVNSFEIFGFDFMIDQNFGVYMIEANTNPCIEINNNPVLARIIPNMLDNAFRIAVDPLIPPPDLNFKRGQEYLQENKFSQVFDYEEEKYLIEELYNKLRLKDIQEGKIALNEENQNIYKELYEESQDEDEDTIGQ